MLMFERENGNCDDDWEPLINTTTHSIFATEIFRSHFASIQSKSMRECAYVPCTCTDWSEQADKR